MAVFAGRERLGVLARGLVARKEAGVLVAMEGYRKEEDGYAGKGRALGLGLGLLFSIFFFNLLQ